MTDHRKDIPSWAFINAQIAQEAIRSGDLARSIRSIEDHYGLPPESFSFINPAYVLSLLYCLIVVPKEIWPIRKDHPVYSEIAKDCLMRDLFKVELSYEQFERHQVYHLIHHLRNAIAHANFSIQDNGRFVFWDQKRKTSAPYFRASLSKDNLEVFISKIGARLANLRSQGEDKLH
ncbi:MAG: hypothetical protein D3906_03080 [Candidatus Electrothrix sp. AUS1_2]|nr:hypothetical protein [Candidatus Electrothrix sp. AUS1_2]